jgi:hypothetical protein
VGAQAAGVKMVAGDRSVQPPPPTVFALNLVVP